jgi:hypothetical protein
MKRTPITLRSLLILTQLRKRANACRFLSRLPFRQPILIPVLALSGLLIAVGGE